MSNTQACTGSSHLRHGALFRIFVLAIVRNSGNFFFLPLESRELSHI
jgi:hypothetical protein